MSSLPQVSVVIPAYNATTTLDRTLVSVRAQTHTNLEIIVVDDGSTDETNTIATRHAKEDNRVCIHTQENSGVAAARNYGIQLATSDWVAPLDADDIWHTHTIEGFLDAAMSAPDPVVMVYTWSRRIDEQDRVLEDLGRPNYRGSVLSEIVAENFTRNASATMLDRRAVLKVGGYDSEQFPNGAEDIDFYLRLINIGPVAVSKGYHVGYRLMPGSMSQRIEHQRSNLEKALNRLESEKHEIHPDLFSLARTNYDLYAGRMSLTAGKWNNLIRYFFSALRRQTLMAAIYLFIFGPYSIISRLNFRRKPVFHELDINQNYSLPVRDFCMSVQNFLYRRYFNGSRVEQT